MNKNYKKGAEDVGKVAEKGFDIVGAEVKTAGNIIEENAKKQNDINNIFADAIDEHDVKLSAIQKKELFGLNTPFDIKSLEQKDKELLVAGLYTLAIENKNVNDYQQAFIRSVRKCVDVKTPQILSDFSVIENIESLTAQKAIMQAFMEFLFLEIENDSFLDEHKKLFSFFSVNKKGQESILDSIHKVYHATGKQGIAEKYDYVAEIKESKELRKGLQVRPIVGDIIQFGKYDWRVLEVQNDKILVITEKIIETKKAYHSKLTNITWEKCDLRKYLNENLYNSFSVEDKAQIIQVTNKNAYRFNPDYSIDLIDGNNTKDYIFLLSLAEVYRYFGGRKIITTHYRTQHGFRVSDENNINRKAVFRDTGNNGWWWWLRTIGSYKIAQYICSDGRVSFRGRHVNFKSDNGGIRPALWLWLNLRV